MEKSAKLALFKPKLTTLEKHMGKE